jgi:hypothetical protein
MPANGGEFPDVQAGGGSNQAKEPRLASNKRFEGRVAALVAELLAYEAEEETDGRAENINDIENATVRIGDQVAREVGLRKLARYRGVCRVR